MYQPSHFREDRLEVMQDLIASHPLATLVSYGSDGLAANHVPLVLHADLSENGTLRGHIARANSLHKDLEPSVEALAVFQGPHHYVTPSWYPSKKEHAKVVPTWNYAVVHAFGPLKFIDDADWLLQQVTSLTLEHEAGRDPQWQVDDAPADFIDKMLQSIIGIELPISRLEGKWKASQNRPEKDKEGVIQGLENEATDIARQMAKLIPS